MAGQKRKVALVMPVKNEEQVVDSTLDAVFRSTLLPDEIIIANGMSTDETVSKIYEYNKKHNVSVKVVDNPTIFCGGGRNIAISNTSCEIVLIADFGNIMDKDWIKHMVRKFNQVPSADIVAGLFKPYVTSDFEHCMAAIHYFEDYILDQLTIDEKMALVPDVLLPGGLSIGITREIWKKAGGFPEWLAKGQDKMFSRKAYAIGAKVVIAWDAIVGHHMRSTPKQVFKQLFFYGRGNGQMRFMSSHLPKLIFFYTLATMLFVLSLKYNWAALPALFLILVYYLKAGLFKVWRVPNSPKKLKHIWLSIMVLFPRDIGTILGHIIGWSEWFLVPKYRSLYKQYTKNCLKKLSIKVS